MQATRRFARPGSSGTPEADAELLASMLEVSARTTREAFRMYRALRTVRQEMVDAALRATE
jgi:methylase of polypeptide subunit release factors